MRTRQLILCLVRPVRAFFAVAVTSVGFVSSASATSVEPKSLEEMVSLADNIWGGKVTSVRMVDADGRDISDADARTGPGGSNTIFLDVTVDRSRILKTVRRDIPEKISIPLWQMWHYSLGQIRRIEGSRSIFFLSRDLKPAHPKGFQRPLHEQGEIKKLIRTTRSVSATLPEQAMQLTGEIW